MTIYVMSHKFFIPPDNSIYKPLQVGAAINDRLPYDGDDWGDNISCKNKNYCELTGLYWMWKNDDSDIVGLCHYRRYLMDEQGELLSEGKIRELLKEHDIILPNKCGLTPSVKEQYINSHHEADMIEARKAVEKLYPDYLEDFDRVMASDKSYITNIFIARKSLSDRYCQWIFDVLEEVERNLDISKYDTYSARVFGFLSERLFTVWVEHNHLKTAEMRTLHSEDTPTISENPDTMSEFEERLPSIIADIFMKTMIA